MSRVPAFLMQSCQLGGKSRLLQQQIRMASTAPLVKIETNEKNGIGLVSLNRPPVNSLSLEFINAIIESIDKCEKENRGLIMTSDNPSIFSAGLDLKEMHKPGEKRLREFWHGVQELWYRLYTLRIPAAAAINGHAPAAGVLLASTCDYRVMVQSDKATIGLNEAKFGLVAPFFLMESFTNVIGKREAEFGLINGKLYKVNEALKIGLVDQVVESKEEAITVSTKVIEKMNTCIPEAFYLTKLATREESLEKFAKRREQDVEDFVSFVFKPSFQKSLDAYMASLTKKKN